MRKIISNTALGVIAAGGMLLVSCGEHDMFNPNNKADQYAANWEQKIGAIDPNQDWSMATTVKATINVAAAGDGVLSIYTENPVHSTAKLLAKAFLDNGTGNVTFDAIKGTEQVFVIARNNGKNVVYGWADIVNGTVDAGKTVAKKAAKTRAGEYCPVTIGDIQTININFLAGTKKTVVLDFNGTQKTLDEWKAQVKNDIANYKVSDIGYNYSNSWVFTFESVFTLPDGTPKNDVWKFPQKADPSWVNDESQWQLKSEVKETEKVEEITSNVNVFMLNGVEKKAVQEPWTLAWGIELFGQGGFFQEKGLFFNETKRNLMNQIGTTLADVEKGFSIVSEGGEITLPFMYGSTDNANRFGYVYYKNGEDPLTQPHYILMDDGKPSSNIYKNSWGGEAVGNMELSGLVGAYGYPGDPSMEIYGTEYKLTYFDENGNATYNFPAGYNIVFFVAPFDGTNYTLSNFNYSLPELNKRIQHTDIWTENPNYDPERGAIKATAWKYNGNVFLGFEDGGGDEDLNDIVFWVEGNFKTPDPLPEVPSTTQPKEEYTSWILACEDLGSTDDYDFNDIVLEVRTKIESEETFEGSAKTGETFKKATLEMRCLAAGGIYEANIHYNNTWIGESHNLLGGRVGTMINTEQLGRFSDWRTLETITDKDAWNNIGDAWSINNVANKIKIVVTIDGKTAESALIKAPDSGEAPQMITVPGDWLWPAERKDIKLAYLSFSNWNANSNDIEWYKKCESGLVIKR